MNLLEAAIAALTAGRGFRSASEPDFVLGFADLGESSPTLVEHWTLESDGGARPAHLTARDFLATDYELF